jgi:DNA-binding NarL/FixJ family response regulator
MRKGGESSIDVFFESSTTRMIYGPLIRSELSRQAHVGCPSLAGKRGIFTTMQPITVVIADAHALFRQRLCRFLAQQEGIEVVSEAKDNLQVLSRLEALQPDILLLDVRMPKMSGLEVLANIRAKSPRTKILILADLFEEEFIARALQHGARGCVLKTARPMELIRAICTTHSGELWAPRKLLTQLLEHLRQRLDELQGPLSVMSETLSEREREVASWAVRGMTNNEIAVQLGISAKTVKTHLQNAFRKLKVSRRGQLLRVPIPAPLALPASSHVPLRRESRT